MLGELKWLMLATGFSFLAIIVMIAGVYRNNKISKQPTETPEEAESNKQRGKKIFIYHAVAAVLLIVLAVVIKLVFGGAGA